MFNTWICGVSASTLDVRIGQTMVQSIRSPQIGCSTISGSSFANPAGETMFSIVLHPLPGTGTISIWFASKINAILRFHTSGASMSHPSLPWDNSFLLCESRGIRAANKCSQTQTSNRNEKDPQRYLQPGTPNISTRWFFWTCFVPETCFLLRTSSTAPGHQTRTWQQKLITQTTQIFLIWRCLNLLASSGELTPNNSQLMRGPSTDTI